MGYPFDRSMGVDEDGRKTPAMRSDDNDPTPRRRCGFRRREPRTLTHHRTLYVFSRSFTGSRHRLAVLLPRRRLLLLRGQGHGTLTSPIAIISRSSNQSSRSHASTRRRTTRRERCTRCRRFRLIRIGRNRRRRVRDIRPSVGRSARLDGWMDGRVVRGVDSTALLMGVGKPSFDP